MQETYLKIKQKSVYYFLNFASRKITGEKDEKYENYFIR